MPNVSSVVGEILRNSKMYVLNEVTAMPLRYWSKKDGEMRGAIKIEKPIARQQCMKSVGV